MKFKNDLMSSKNYYKCVSKYSVMKERWPVLPCQSVWNKAPEHPVRRAVGRWEPQAAQSAEKSQSPSALICAKSPTVCWGGEAQQE